MVGGRRRCIGGKYQPSVTGVPKLYNNTRADRRAHNRGQWGKSAARERPACGAADGRAPYFVRGDVAADLCS